MTTLFHYCNSETLHSIVTNRSIWLCSLTCSNDTQEGKILAKILQEVAKDHGSPHPKFASFVESLDYIFDIYDGLGLCLSEKPDLLSQWRGYANDARGFSIGFNKEYLNRLAEKLMSEDKSSFVVEKIIYDMREQKEIAAPIYKQFESAMKEAENIEDTDQKKILYNTAMTIGMIQSLVNLFKLKSNAFSEEQEWRVIGHYTAGDTDDCKFRVVNDRIAPYKSIFLEDFGLPVIDKVIIGPRNLTETKTLQHFLEINGFNDVKIEKSSLSYR